MASTMKAPIPLDPVTTRFAERLTGGNIGSDLLLGQFFYIDKGCDLFRICRFTRRV